MPRNMSFMLTTDPVREQIKDVTRRLGWWFLKPGDLVWAVEKAMGLKKGEKIKRICLIRIVSTRREPLNVIDQADVIREGFPAMSPADFVAMFCKHNGCWPDSDVNRIKFAYENPINVTRLAPGGRNRRPRPGPPRRDRAAGVPINTLGIHIREIASRAAKL